MKHCIWQAQHSMPNHNLLDQKFCRMQEHDMIDIQIFPGLFWIQSLADNIIGRCEIAQVNLSHYFLDQDPLDQCGNGLYARGTKKACLL